MHNDREMVAGTIHETFVVFHPQFEQKVWPNKSNRSSCLSGHFNKSATNVVCTLFRDKQNKRLIARLQALSSLLLAVQFQDLRKCQGIDFTELQQDQEAPLPSWVELATFGDGLNPLRLPR